MRASGLWREYYGLAAHGRLPASSPHTRRRGVSGVMQRSWQRFRQRGWCGRAMMACGYGSAGVCAYAAVCGVVHVLHYRTIDALFHPREDYLLDDWRDVEPTLREGDIVLMRGIGLMSWAIATAQLALGVLHPAALRYSHVAVVVEPAVYADDADKGSDSDSSHHHYSVDGDRDNDSDNDGMLTTSSLQLNRSIQHAQQQQQQQKPPHSSPHGATGALRVADLLRAEASHMDAPALHRRCVRGAVILEAMDNVQFHVPDIHGGRRYNAVQRVVATQRVCSRDVAGQHAYAHFAVRRLRHVARTPAVVQRIRRFCQDNEGRPMDGSVLYVLSFVHPRLYEWLRPSRFARKEVSCSELILELYQMLGLVRRRWRWVPLTRAEVATYKAALAHDNNDNNMVDDGVATSTTLSTTQSLSSPTPPPPQLRLPLAAPADASVRRTGALHVYENCYARADVEAQRPLHTRDLPVVAAGDVIEGEDDMQYAMPTAAAAAASAHTATRAGSATTTTTTTTAPAASRPSWRAGDVAPDRRGRLRQLRWYYRHNSLQTSPYHFTEGVDTRVIDWMPGYSLGQEIRMQIPTQDDDDDDNDHRTSASATATAGDGQSSSPRQ